MSSTQSLIPFHPPMSFDSSSWNFFTFAPATPPASASARVGHRILPLTCTVLRPMPFSILQFHPQTTLAITPFDTNTLSITLPLLMRQHLLALTRRLRHHPIQRLVNQRFRALLLSTATPPPTPLPASQGASL
ncbi:hypothetical protein PAPYR_10195 [Paratrimastix pyriformis]|uniref:Uncharacterized protein n=1 Tax=Paratrimastix pyriformis TaxID=342808 RepID=A0ABQ8UC92_9EUKA|nr:hypothetical protein PAPYR_10195 [Paratrimastix pyriformis]